MLIDCIKNTKDFVPYSSDNHLKICDTPLLIDYKSTVFDASVLQKWLERIILVYNVTLEDEGGLNAYPAMRAGYANFVRDPMKLSATGVTHVITDEVLPQYTLLGERGRWRLYEVK